MTPYHLRISSLSFHNWKLTRMGLKPRKLGPFQSRVTFVRGISLETYRDEYICLTNMCARNSG